MWEKEYKDKNCYWGLAPDSSLAKYLDRIPKGKALDIGAGEGRNSLFLSKNGFEVESIDINPDGLEKYKKIAGKNNLPVSIKVVDINNFQFKPDKYSLIVSSASISFLKRSQVKQIIDKIKKSLAKEGVVYIKDFTVADPVFRRFSELTGEIEHNTFYSNKLKCYRSFFEKNELKKIFSDYYILYYKEYMQRDAHPDIHYHGLVEIIAQKMKDDH